MHYYMSILTTTLMHWCCGFMIFYNEKVKTIAFRSTLSIYAFIFFAKILFTLKYMILWTEHHSVLEFGLQDIVFYVLISSHIKVDVDNLVYLIRFWMPRLSLFQYTEKTISHLTNEHEVDDILRLQIPDAVTFIKIMDEPFPVINVSKLCKELSASSTDFNLYIHTREILIKK